MTAFPLLFFVLCDWLNLFLLTTITHNLPTQTGQFLCTAEVSSQQEWMHERTTHNLYQYSDDTCDGDRSGECCPRTVELFSESRRRPSAIDRSVSVLMDKERSLLLHRSV
jgi:hypothetical protein